MPAFHYVAERRADGSFTFRPADRQFNTGALQHRVVKQLGADISVVVWWPERVDPATEEQLSETHADQVARGLGITRTTPAS